MLPVISRIEQFSFNSNGYPETLFTFKLPGFPFLNLLEPPGFSVKTFGRPV